jgi:hypothetical protein
MKIRQSAEQFAVAWMLPDVGQFPRRRPMSRARVGLIIEKLLTDESLRTLFALDRLGAIARLCSGGFVLTGDEIELFCIADFSSFFAWRTATTARLQ